MGKLQKSIDDTLVDFVVEIMDFVGKTTQKLQDIASAVETAAEEFKNGMKIIVSYIIE